MVGAVEAPLVTAGAVEVPPFVDGCSRRQASTSCTTALLYVLVVSDRRGGASGVV